MLRKIAAILFLFGGQVLADARPVAELVAFQGTTEVRERPGQDWLPARSRHPLPALSTVRTGAASWASILFVDQTQVKLSSHSRFQVKSVARERQGKTLVELRKGKAWTRSKAPPARFIMQTPTANAGIQGTDWVVEVADDGTTRLSVLSGEIRFYNDLGTLLVGRNEEALAAPGRAPVKRPLVNPRERVQWVGVHPLQWQRYPELLADARFDAPVQAAREGRPARALAALAAIPEAQHTPASRLLEADLLQGGGDLAGAERRLRAALAAYPGDPRLAAALARLALLMDDEEASGAWIDRGLGHHPEAVDLWLARGDLARWQGRREAAEAAYARAAELAPGDARPRLGSGRVAGDTADYRSGRGHLLAALERSPGWAEALGELGWLETRADRLEAARRHLEQALSADPGDYLALTGLGYLDLKSGRPRAALRHLLAANSIEPSYARILQVMAMAYYQLHRLDAALGSLARASELDPRDPMPWLLTSLILQDQWQPGDAIRAAREGIERLPYLRSLDQLAVDLKGSANLGSAYALFGLEDWASQAAQDSYDPLWAGSHFFLANRYPGEFSRNAELGLGFLTDPTAFGTDPRWQPLATTPGVHGRLAYWHAQGGEQRIRAPLAATNGYVNRGLPFAWLLQGQVQDWRDTGQRAEAGQLTLGLGARPISDLRLFLFANAVEPDTTREVAGGEQRITGDNRRIDAGVNLRHGPHAQTWVKAGRGRERSEVEGPDPLTPTTRKRSEHRPERDDLQLRHTRRLSDGLALSLGLEWARRVDGEDYRLWRNADAPPSSSGSDHSRDESTLAYASIQLSPRHDLSLQTDLSYLALDLDTDLRARVGDIELVRGDYRDSSGRLQYALGGVYRPTPHWTLRAAVQDWTRPVSFATLAPVATAGIPVDDLLTLPGGRLRRGKAQLEWRTPRTFTHLWGDYREIRNIAFDPLGEPENGATELAELSLLDFRSFRSLALEIPEGIPLFSSGRVREWGLGHEHLVGEHLSLYLRYRLADGENTRWFAGNALPYVPEHQGSVGLTWLPAGQWLVQARATYRSERFADEANNRRLAQGWDAGLMVSRQSRDQDWQADLYLGSLIGGEDATTAGLALTLRF